MKSTRLLIVASTCVNHDAISNAVVNHAETAVALLGRDNVAIVSPHIDREIPCEGLIAHDDRELRRLPAYKKSTHLLLHWGIWHPLFNIAQARLSRKKTTICFHNMTPPHLVSAKDTELMQRSAHQLQALTKLPRNTFGTFSEFNRRTLTELGTANERIVDLPFAIENSPLLTKAAPNSPLRVLSVGRMAPAKGYLTVIEALQQYCNSTGSEVLLRIASSTTFGDQNYLSSLIERTERNPPSLVVEFMLDIPDAEMSSLYEWADMFMLDSNHEGLCVPVIEAMRSNVRIVTSNSGNLAYLVKAPDVAVEHGSVDRMLWGLQRRLASFSDVAPDSARTIQYFSQDSVTHYLRMLLFGR